MINSRNGETKLMNCGQNATIIEYRNSRSMDIMFETGEIVLNKEYQEFKNGKIKNIEKQHKDRLHQINFDNQGNKMEIISYRNSRDIDVLFEDKWVIENCSYGNFLNKKIKNYLKPTIFDKGYYGTLKPNKREYPYSIWFRMMERCYSKDKKIREKHYYYDDISVCEEWFNYQEYKKWYLQNIWTNEFSLQVDKDILIKGNKIYSPNTCVMVDSKINNLFIKSNKARGELPIGVSYDNNNHNRYRAYISKTKDAEKKQIHLGYFNNPTNAFYAYKEAKEEYIKEVADEYKKKYINFPQKLYNAMYTYEVEVTD